jgi:LysR family transcriptional regulator, glycine cleavage system transcriptional activator
MPVGRRGRGILGRPAGFRLGTGSWSGLVAPRLFSADLVPVCAPRLAERLATPASLKRALLLRVAHAGEDWPLWLKAAGLSGVTATGPIFEYYDHALKAASDGFGIALASVPTSTTTSGTAAWWPCFRLLLRRGASGI